MSISFTVLRDTIHAVQADYQAMRRELLKVKIIFLQLADNQQKMLAAMRAAGIPVEITPTVEAADADKKGAEDV